MAGPLRPEKLDRLAGHCMMLTENGANWKWCWLRMVLTENGADWGWNWLRMVLTENGASWSTNLETVRPEWELQESSHTQISSFWSCTGSLYITHNIIRLVHIVHYVKWENGNLTQLFKAHDDHEECEKNQFQINKRILSKTFFPKVITTDKINRHNLK